MTRKPLKSASDPTFKVLLIMLLCLSGCSQKFQDTNATIRSAWESNSDAKISPQQIQKIPYASIFLRINGGPKLFLALALVDQDKKTNRQQLKWLSADKGMIVTENGRIVKTSGFLNSNLANLTLSPSKQSSLLSFKNTDKQATKWVYDWQPDFRYGFAAQATQASLGYETITTPLWSKKTHHIRETVRFNTLKTSIQNDYWIDKNNKTVKTIQYLGPKMDKVEITFIKPYVASPEKKEGNQ